jgi:feruloyl esterase
MFLFEEEGLMPVRRPLAWRLTAGRRASKLRLLALAAGLGALTIASPVWAAACEDLARLKLPETVIKSAEAVPAGGFAALGALRRPDLPPFCRVIASVRAAPDSDIGVEVWLPQTHWAGVFHGNGNGGFAGVLAAGYGGMQAGLRRGYATAVTDTGTAPATPLDGDALIGHPRRWRDWGRLSTHVMTVTGKAIAEAFYGEPARRAYYTGCSTGGQQGLIEALYYPEDYDGVLVGAPVINRTWGHAAVLWDGLAANLQPGHRLSDAKLTLLNKAVLSACAGRANGLAGDRFIADPLACRFDPAVLTCHGADAGACLTPAEVQTARAFYSGPTDRSGHPLYYGWPRGSEAPGRFGWNFLQSLPKGEPPFDSLFKWVFGPSWDWRSFDFGRDMPKIDAELGPVVNDATRGDIGAFRARGGKLIIYHGWADTLVAPGQTVAFYDRVARTSGGMAKAQGFARLFMAPGVMHCGAGSGPDGFNAANAAAAPPASESPGDDLFAALTQWVEHGQAPAKVIATSYVDGAPAKGVALQRPLCAYPARAWYRGAGDVKDAGSFVCSVRKPAPPHPGAKGSPG